MENAVEIKNVVKTFYSDKNKFFSLRRKRVEVFKDLNLTVKNGEIIALLGANGCGKTTIFKMLTTLVLPNKGEIKVKSYDPVKNPIPVRRLISFIPSEERSFYFRLTGRQNLHFFASLCNLKRNEAAKRIATLTGIIDISEHLDKRYQEYSTGLKQKLNLIRGLLRDSEIIILDEPMKSIDRQSTIEIMKFIKEELVGKQGKSVLMTTHNLSEAEETANRFAIIDSGKIIKEFNQHDLKNNSLSSLYESALKK